MRLLVVGIIPLVLVAFSSCRTPRPQSYKPKAIIGKDNRSKLLDKTLSTLVGFISTPFGTCTAFVSHSDQITTSAHCIREVAVKDIVFKRTDGMEISVLDIRKVFAKADVAYLLVAKQESYLKQGKFNSSMPATVISYDDESNTLQTNQCAANGSGIIYHVCDTLKGSSGSPIMQNDKVVGVHLGVLENNKSNVGVQLSSIEGEDVSTLDFVSERKTRLCNQNLIENAGFKGARHWKNRSSNLVAKKGMLLSNDVHRFHTQPSIYQDDKEVAGTFRFKVTVKSSKSIGRTMQLVFWKDSMKRESQTFALTNKWQDFSFTATIGKEISDFSPITNLRSEIYWFDNNEVDIMIKNPYLERICEAGSGGNSPNPSAGKKTSHNCGRANNTHVCVDGGTVPSGCTQAEIKGSQWCRWMPDN